MQGKVTLSLLRVKMQPVLAIIFVALFPTVAGQYRKLGEIDVELAGFSNPYEHRNPAIPTERYSLLLASFNPIPFTEDILYMFEYVGKYLDDLENVIPNEISTNLTWPREPTQVPYDVFEFDAIAQPDGFLVPGKNFGALKIIDMRQMDNPLTYDISTYDGQEEEWFYHRATWIDMDKDGLQDAFICRAYRDPITEITTTQMLWLKHPTGNDKFSRPWAITIIASGLCDTFSIKHNIVAAGRTYEVLLTIGYFTNRLMLHWTEDPQGRFYPSSNVQSRDIDVGGKFFDLKVTDLNMDGTLDLLVSVNEEVNGTLLAYEFPEDFRTGQFKKHVLKDGFAARSGARAAGSPGSCRAFYPTQDTSGKPWILLSGDDDGRAYILRPYAEDWQYDMQAIVDDGYENTIGQPSVFDSNGNGKKEIFVPSYYEGLIHVFSYEN